MAVLFFYAPLGGIIVGIISAVAVFRKCRASDQRCSRLRQRRPAARHSRLCLTTSRAEAQTLK
jgi:hypothetical protein